MVLGEPLKQAHKAWRCNSYLQSETINHSLTHPLTWVLWQTGEYLHPDSGVLLTTIWRTLCLSMSFGQVVVLQQWAVRHQSVLWKQRPDLVHILIVSELLRLRNAIKQMGSAVKCLCAIFNFGQYKMKCITWSGQQPCSSRILTTSVWVHYAAMWIGKLPLISGSIGSGHLSVELMFPL